MKLFRYAVMIFLSLSALLADEFLVKSFELIGNDLTARRHEKKDINEIPCAVLKIRTDITGPFLIETNLGVTGNVEYKKGELVVYISENERQIRIAREGFIKMTYDIPIRPERWNTYQMVLTRKDNSLPVVINSIPADAEKYIDGKLLGTEKLYNVERGKHTLLLKKAGYKDLERQITVSEENKYLENLRMTELEPVMVTLRSEPNEADIFINNVNEGKTNKQLFKFPGDYDLRLMKSKYETIEQRITVTESGSNSWNFKLEKTTAMLTLNITPADAEVLINGEAKKSRTIELAPGRYRIEVKKPGWHGETRTIEIKKGRDRSESFILKQKTGKLQFVVEPMEAKVVMKSGASQFATWSGSAYKKDIPIGDYTLELSASGYESQSKTISISEKQTATLNVSLKKAVFAESRVNRESGSQTGTTGTVTDIDGNVYRTVKIGNQWWMAENLKVSKYRDGTAIPNVTDNSQWTKRSTGAMCWYDNKQSNGNKYGALYNWHAVNDRRGLAPQGWRVPTDEDWKKLEIYLGMSQSQANQTGIRGSDQGKKLKSKSGWNGTDIAGFGALPGGFRSYDNGSFYTVGYNAYFWSSSEVLSHHAWGRRLYGDYEEVDRYYYSKTNGFSVRCVRD